LDGKHQSVKVTLLDYDHVALFMNRNRDYPLLRAVKLLGMATKAPPDLGNFLANPWTLESLEAAAKAKRKGPGSGGIAVKLEEKARREAEEAAEWESLTVEEQQERLAAAHANLKRRGAE
jgi:hypothetical protein